MKLIAFSQPDTRLSDALMAPVMKPDDGAWRSSRILIDEAMPGHAVWTYVPGPHGVECQAYQWGKILRRRWQPYQWTVEETDLEHNWRAPDRIALIPMRGVWQWPMGMNLAVLNALRKTRNDPCRINEGRQLITLSPDPIAMVRGIRGSSWRIVRPRREKAYWKPGHCVLVITRRGVPVVEGGAAIGSCLR